MVRQSTFTVIVGRRALLREGITSLLRHTVYKIVASAPHASELRDITLPRGRPTLVILCIGGRNGDLDESAESIRQLRSQFAGSKIVVVAEITAPADIQRVLALSADAYIHNLGSRDILLKSLELMLMDRQVLVLDQSKATSVMSDDAADGRCA
jgi:DNA-binding NarL/FixJ family response regulator